MKTIIASYFVVDCEHQGDIDRACDEVRELGGRVLTTEWDGEDCGEAYVYCEMPKDKFDSLRALELEWQNCEYLRDYYRQRGLVK